MLWIVNQVVVVIRFLDVVVVLCVGMLLDVLFYDEEIDGLVLQWLWVLVLVLVGEWMVVVVWVVGFDDVYLVVVEDVLELFDVFVGFGGVVLVVWLEMVVVYL